MDGRPLVFEGLGKQFGRVQALTSLSFSVKAGEIFGFLGPNGAGKTTAIHLAMGFLRPSTGGGTLLGLPFGRARAARADVGYVPDAPVFFAGSALDAVLFAARLNWQGGAEVRARALHLLRWMDLPPERQDARKFSRGMQQRLALVQALITRPRLLMLDEPTAALDPPGVMLVREALEQARGDGAAVFFSSHQLQEVESLCDRAAFLESGRLLHIGTLSDLLREGAMAHITLRGLGVEDAFVVRWSAALRAPAGLRGDHVFTVPVAMQQEFLEAAWLTGAELVRVERERRSLEDLFAERKSAHPSEEGAGAR